MELGFPNKYCSEGLRVDKNCDVIHCNHDNNNFLHSRSNIVKLRSGDKSFNLRKCAFNDEADNCTIMQMAQLYCFFYCYKHNKYIKALLKFVNHSTLCGWFLVHLFHFHLYDHLCLTILYKSPQFWNKCINCTCFKLQFNKMVIFFGFLKCISMSSKSLSKLPHIFNNNKNYH